MIPPELTKKISKDGMPIIWQVYAIVLFLLVTSQLFVSDPAVKYSTDISIAILTSIGVISSFFICKKPLTPYGILVSSITLMCCSMLTTSLIFFGFQINTSIPLWLELSGIIVAGLFCINLLYVFEKQYHLKGVTIDFILILLSITCLAFLVPPNLLNTILYEFDGYTQSRMINAVLGSIFLFMLLTAWILSKKVKPKDILLGAMILSLSTHFHIDAYISFTSSNHVEVLNKVSWFFYQFPLVLTIFYMFSQKLEYSFQPNITKDMGLKLLWVAPNIGVLIVPICLIYRWLLDFPNIEPVAIAIISGVMCMVVISRMVLILSKYEKQRQTLKDTAFTDSLTGVLNYLGLHSSVGNLENLLVLNINIEDFKSINDMYDRKFGDQVLISLANRIKNAPGVLYTARTTGDNFLAILQVFEENIETTFAIFEEEIGVWDTVYNKRVAVPLTYGGSHSAEPMNLDVLVRNAEIGLKKSRSQKRHFTLHQDTSNDAYTPSFRADLPRHELREILQRSIDNNNIPVHYQPIYETGTGALKALEMLIRVHSIKHGLLAPGQFLDQAKSYGLLTDLTYTCINMIAKDFDRLPEVTINVNVPPYMLDDRQTLNNFIKCFTKNNLPPKRFCVEVTEDGDIPTESLVPAINLLKDAGFAIAMDDFGTGYSSLGRLSSLPFDSVKIDRSLLLEANAGNKTILESSINLVKRLGVSGIVVEGVETVEQLALITELGAESAQGYLFSKPVPVTEDHQFPMISSYIATD